MLSALILTRLRYPAVHLAVQPVYQRSVQHGPLVLVSAPRKSPAPTIDNVVQKQRTRFDKIKPKNKYTLETVSDVEEFINELKSKMIEEINSGREITL